MLTSFRFSRLISLSKNHSKKTGCIRNSRLLNYRRLIATDSSKCPSNHPSSKSSEVSDKVYSKSNALWPHLLPTVPLIASTAYNYFTKGPPAKSWTLSTDVTIAVMRDFLTRSSEITVEKIQGLSTISLPNPPSMHTESFTVPDGYRERAGEILKNVISEEDQDRMSWDWEQDRKNSPPIQGEWMQSKGDFSDPCKESTVLYLHGGAYYLGCYGIYRFFLTKLINFSKGRTCSINYRLAPQHPFPAALEDALATYLYLIDPPKGDEHRRVDPKKIVIAGDSAGGGLTFALLLAIRDANLPNPSGAMTLSPWMDLTHSLPSIISNIFTDYLPAAGFKHADSPAVDYSRLPLKKAIKKAVEKVKSSVKRDEGLTDESGHDSKVAVGPFGEQVPVTNSKGEDIYRIHFYADNKELKIPFVSPIFDRKRLKGLPRLLVQCGTAERLRDESVYLALEASDSFPEATEKSGKAGRPTSVTLEMFTDQPHVFQLLFFNKPVTKAIENLATFLKEVTGSPAVKDTEDDESLDEKKLYSYKNDNLLTIRNVNSLGEVTDITEKFKGDFTKKEWEEWKTRLARHSLKERLDDVTKAYDAILEKQKQEANEISRS